MYSGVTKLILRNSSSRLLPLGRVVFSHEKQKEGNCILLKAVTAYFSSKQLLPLAFAEHYGETYRP